MKKQVILIMSFVLLQIMVFAQPASKELEAAVVKLDQATGVKDYQGLADRFLKIAGSEKKNWLAWYYAAFCNAKTGMLYETDGEKIEPFTDKAEEQAKIALALLDTAKQKEELVEVYCVFYMLNRAKVFINPQTYGKFGMTAFTYSQRIQRLKPDNPRYLYLMGWEKYITPKNWGGDKTKAKELLNAALSKLNAVTVTGSYPHWGKTEAEALLKKIK